MRLDLNVSKKLGISRNKAATLIKNGKVSVDGCAVLKPSFEIECQDVQVSQMPLYVSRAGDKLHFFLQEYPLDVRDKTCLDIGSSTGGFVEVLLKNGAKEVTAVDVGSEQLHKSLRDDKRVKLFENQDIREFGIDATYDIVTCDVSFISFKDIAFYMDKFAKKDIIILFKPQFEVGRGVKRSKKGVVKDEKAIIKAKDEFEKVACEYGWELRFISNSKVAGKEGNVESFYAYKKR